MTIKSFFGLRTPNVEFSYQYTFDLPSRILYQFIWAHELTNYTKIAAKSNLIMLFDSRGIETKLKDVLISHHLKAFRAKCWYYLKESRYFWIQIWNLSGSSYYLNPTDSNVNMSLGMEGFSDNRTYEIDKIIVISCENMKWYDVAIM